MKFSMVGRGVIAATIAIAATLGGAAPAQAQEEGWEVCVYKDSICTTVPLCARNVCVSGVPENVDAVTDLVVGVVITVLNKVPDVPEEVCTPPLPREPICVTT